MKRGPDRQSLGQGTGGRWENPRRFYEALSSLRRPSILERGSSTTKRGQAVSTRVYQSDPPSLIAARALTQELTG
jgi:hypothetical protein